LAQARQFVEKWHEWWLKDCGDGQSWRNGNHRGLLECSAVATGVPCGISKGPEVESGMDDSPMYDEAGYDEHTCTMKMNAIGLN
jgi:hypothetical protein